MKHVITSQWLERVVNQYLALDPEGLKNLSALQGKVLCIEVLGLNKRYYIFPDEDSLGVSEDYEAEPDTTIRGTPSALLKLGMQADTAGLMLSGEIEIVGDVRTGREFKKCLANLNIDWEEHLSRVIGDVPANITFDTLSQISSWTRQAINALTADVSEYLQEESRDIVTGAELNEFCSDVDQLRDDVDRIEALIKRRNAKE